MQTIIAPAAALVESNTPADDSWGAKVDASIARYRASLRKPATVEAPAGPVPFTGDPADPVHLHDEHFYTRFIRTPELVKARLDAVSANLARVEAQLDASPVSFADELVEAIARDDREIPADDPADFSTDPMWEECWTTTEEVEAPAPLTVEELIRGVPHYGTDGPASRRADGYALASAEHSGWTLGFEGFEVDEVCPPQHYGPDEANAFITGVEKGAAERWTQYGRDIDELDRERTMEALYADPFRDVEEHEFAEARMSRPAMAMA
jgi:hypothetical protein